VKSGIQGMLLDFGWKHAGITRLDSGRLPWAVMMLRHGG